MHALYSDIHTLRRTVLRILLLLIFMSGGEMVLADNNNAETEEIGEIKVGSGRKRATRGYYFTEMEGDSVMMIVLNEVVVYPPLKFKNKKEEEFYWRTVRDVRKTLPYAKLICETLLETYEYIETFPTQKEREKYLKKMEKSIFEQYKPILKRFSKRQAKVLIKLIQRETHQTSYEIVKAFLGSFRAIFWQGFGKLFGVSLKTEYKPNKNREDAILERVACAVEEGRL